MSSSNPRAWLPSSAIDADVCWEVGCAALGSGSVASVTSAAALAVCGALEERSPAGPLNAPSQWIWGEEEAYVREPTLRHTLTGYLVHHASSLLWAAVFEAYVRRAQRPTPLQVTASAAAVAGIAYVVDRNVRPRRLRPGFKKHLGPRSLFAVYVAFGVGLAATALTRLGR